MSLHAEIRMAVDELRALRKKLAYLEMRIQQRTDEALDTTDLVALRDKIQDRMANVAHELAGLRRSATTES